MGVRVPPDAPFLSRYWLTPESAIRVSTASAIPAADKPALPGTATPSLIEVSISDADASGHGLSCGGSARILVQRADSIPSSAWQALATGLPICLVTSLVVVRRKLSYEWWYAVHFTAYAGVALAWFHMIPDGNELISTVWAADSAA